MEISLLMDTVHNTIIPTVLLYHRISAMTTILDALGIIRTTSRLHHGVGAADTAHRNRQCRIMFPPMALLRTALLLSALLI